MIFTQLLHKIKNAVVSLRVSILSIFVTFFTVTILLLIIFITLHFQKILEITSFAMMNQVSQTVIEDVGSELNPVKVQAQFTAELIEHDVFSPESESQMVNYTLELLKILPIVQGVVWGDEDGNLVISYKENNNTITSEVLNRKISPHKHYINKRNVQGNIVERINSTDFNYDPRARPWYIHAKQTKQTIWTDVIKLRVLSSLGLTVATPVYYPNGSLRGVLGLGVKLEDLLRFMSNQKISPNGFAFIVTEDGRLIAFPNCQINADKNVLQNVRAISTVPWLEQSLNTYLETKSQNFSLKHAGETYLFSYKPISLLKEYGWLIGIVVPENDLTHELRRVNLMILLGCLFILSVGIYVVSKLVGRLVKPIKKLVRETQKIKEFELTEDIQIQSRIKEVLNLADAFQALQVGLRAFQKYVPKTLVKQLIATRENSRVGGSRKQLVVFFSDIENFTSISESMDPNQLMVYLCEYFEALTQVINQHQGTIDKFIGDAVMAFWGAPIEQNFACQKAALAALGCQKRLEEMNKNWQSQGLQPLITRIGLHVGDTIVGNLGSSDRINYTVLGDNVNLASRFEKLNKVYGTKIIISDALYEVLKNEFNMRWVDCVMVKGKLLSTNIYELISDKTSPPEFDLAHYETHFSAGYSAYKSKDWEAAIHYFKQCLHVYPADTVAKVFVKRCQAFLTHPPADDWDGVWRFTD